MDRAIAALAARQHGVVSLRQTEQLGFDEHRRAFRLRSGRWRSPFPAVYQIAGAPETWRGRLLAACWATSGVAAASHRSAAALWNLPGGREDLTEITCERWKRGFVPGFVVHETGLLAPDDSTEVDAVPVTTVEQTLLGLAAVVAPTVVEMAFDRALQRGLTTAGAVEAFVERKGARGRNGIGVLRKIVRSHDPLAGLPESAMETKLKRLIRAHGLPAPVFQHVVRDRGRFVARVDAAYPALRLAIEFDSYEHHTGRHALVRDTDRRNRLMQIRWRTVTFTAADLGRDGGPAIEALVVALRAAG